MFTGLKKPYIAKLNESTGTYSDGFLANAGVEVVLTPSFNENNIAGDDSILKKIYKFKEATVAAKVTKLPIAAASVLFGHTVDGLQVTRNVSDEANYVGYGYITTIVNDSDVDTYKGTIIPKVKFMDGAETYTTNGDSITITAPAIAGTAIVNDDGDWLIEKEFDTETEALEFVQVYLAIADKCTTPVSNVDSGTYATEQTVTLTAGTGETIYYTDDGLTPDATSNEYLTALTISASTMIRAIAIKSLFVNSEIAEYEIIISA